MSKPRLSFERIGHRGAPREFPENTLPSFQRAIELGADAVELDVHVTADGVAVVHHDLDVKPKGRAKRPLTAMTWAEVGRIELAPRVFVPSLEQVLALVGARATVYVELKGRAVEESAIAAIRASAARCAVHSFDHRVVARAAQIAPEVRRGILFDAYPADVARSMRDASALDVWPQWELIDDALVERVHGAGGRVIAWTVNSTDAAERLLALGVDGLCGDDVRLFPQRA
ncbi:MAG TPA: glycerophosphodiester phosphodiesterase [Gemmatimonadaceae bacterium]|jgi:glycerophosphoryl diester phosphodiesterase